ncbi:MAG: hypothetical protein PHP97_04880 [Candidatus Shapirobacteria bacterium]|nr:hypothetical protein [Candidatus Shapirobacteria bacterium]MDD3002378.1 hypothetical protein [Candidatus Shapirobacteria bacterium]MDD4383314.1 hypothetical protein [Candidatus Shapirobacteria bacterium]
MSSPEFLYQIKSGNPISSNEDSTLYECHIIQKNLDGSIVEKTWQEEVSKQTKLNIPLKKSQ